MRYLTKTTVVALGGLSFLFPATGANAQQSKGGVAQAPAATVAAPVYKPPLLGAPGGRVGGGTRSAGREFVLSVLAPDHSGLTLREHPSLYWYISDKTSLPVELTVIDPRATRPVLETRLPSPTAAGIHRIRLADHRVRLDPEITYQWFIAVIPDTGRRSRDILAGGTIVRITAPEALKNKLAETPPAEAPHIYAEAGVWYDALAALSELIEGAPNDAALRRQRGALVSQVGLSGLGEDR